VNVAAVAAFEPVEATGIEANDQALLALSRKRPDGSRELEFAVPDAHCAACIHAIETGLCALTQVESARVNLTRRSVRVTFSPDKGPPSALVRAIRASGYETYLLEGARDSAGDPVLNELVRAMAVAGFAAGNIMLFSVSIWSGADAATRDLFHWISAMIAVPAIAYSGRIFFRSAWRAVRVGHTNMDVPISIGILLATGLSFLQTVRSAEHAYFDASTTLIFFLLAGRTLDHLMRERVRAAITNLARMQPRGATRLHEDGTREFVALDDIVPGMILELKAGERVPVDSSVVSANATFDYAIVTGESAPQSIRPEERVVAGAAVVARPVKLCAERTPADSYLATMVDMMEAVESARTRPRRIADRAAAIYAPVVHAIAAATYLGWGIATGDWYQAIVNAVAVLIITCPCALGLAVPIAQVVAAGKLFEHGILMTDGAALERAAEVDGVAFDKTGTLTLGQPRVTDVELYDATSSGIAAALATASAHPLSRAIAAALPPTSDSDLTEIAETPGQGIEGRSAGHLWRLGSAGWCGLGEDGTGDAATSVWLSRDGQPAGRFRLADPLKEDARATVVTLSAMGLPVRLLSGDAAGPVAAAATGAGIRESRARLLPADKVADVGRGRTMMVGDGINDAPALRAAHVSMAPTTAADVGRAAADFVFNARRLDAVPFTIAMARRTMAIIRENLVLAIGYNAIAVPLAVSGRVTPLIAAIAMSASSLIVVGNALRLRWPAVLRAHPVTAGLAGAAEATG
jgi:Cu2+-exporting ATPase